MLKFFSNDYLLTYRLICVLLRHAEFISYHVISVSSRVFENELRKLPPFEWKTVQKEGFFCLREARKSQQRIKRKGEKDKARRKKRGGEKTAMVALLIVFIIATLEKITVWQEWSIWWNVCKNPVRYSKGTKTAACLVF